MTMWLRARLGPIVQHEQLLMITVSTMLVTMGQGVISPVLPLLADKFGVGAAAIGLTLTTFGLARLVLNIPMGIAADRYGRRILLVSGPLIAAIGMFGSGMAGSLATMLVWRFVAGAGSAIYATGSQIYVADIATPATRARYIGTNQSMVLLGLSFGPGVGGFAAELWGLAAPFYLVGAASLIAMGYAYFRIPETRHLQPAAEATPRRAGEAAPRGAWLQLLLSRDFALVSMMNAAIFFTRTGGRQTIMPLLGASALGLSAAALGSIFAAMALLNMCLVMPSSYMADRLGRKWSIIPSGILVGASLFMIGGTHSYWMFIVGAMLHAVSSSISGPAPTAYAVDIAPSSARGLSLGMFRSAGDFGFMIGPPLIGAIADATSFEWAMYANGAMMIVASLVFLLARETGGRQIVAERAAAARA